MGKHEHRGIPGRAPRQGGSSGRRPQAARGPAVEFVYEDRDIIVVDKPEGLPVIAPEGSRTRNLYDLVTMHIQRNNPKGRAAVVHRLDRDTSGIMVFARHAAAKKALMEHWNEFVFERAYIAVVEGRIRGSEGVFDDWLLENRAGQVYRVDPGSPGALRAITRWKALEAGDRFSLLELHLETGRKHQIRAQLAAAGYSVAGDSRYGARSDPLGRLCLHAHILGIEQPFSHERFSFESPAPEVFAALFNAGGSSR